MNCADKIAKKYIELKIIDIVPELKNLTAKDVEEAFKD